MNCSISIGVAKITQIQGVINIANKRISTQDIVQALLFNNTQRQAAQELGITECTLSKKIKSQAVQNQLRAIRREQVQILSNRLVSNSSKALNNLVDMLDSTNEYNRYNSAVKILDLTEKYIKIEDLQSRIEALEERLKE